MTPVLQSLLFMHCKQVSARTVTKCTTQKVPNDDSSKSNRKEKRKQENENTNLVNLPNQLKILVNFNPIYLPLLLHCRIHFEGLFVKPEASVVVPLHSFVVSPTILLLYRYLELNKKHW